jgi:hypothetical protein
VIYFDRTNITMGDFVHELPERFLRDLDLRSSSGQVCMQYDNRAPVCDNSFAWPPLIELVILACASAKDTRSADRNYDRHFSRLSPRTVDMAPSHQTGVFT